MSYVSRVTKDLDRWISRGWVDADQRPHILDDLGTRSRGWTAAGALAILGAVLLAMSALTFVAANWDAMPRLIRFGVLVAAMCVSMFGAGRSLDHGAPALGHALAVLGVALFGATIMLTAQTFNMTSFRNTAVLIWAGSALLTALVIPSRPVLILATILGGLWAWLEIGNPFVGGALWSYGPVWLISAVAASRMDSKVALHLLAAGLILWVGHLFYWYDHQTVIADIALHASATLVFGTLALAGAVLRDRHITGGGILAAWCAVVTVALALALQFHLDGDSSRDNLVASAAYLPLALPPLAMLIGLQSLRQLTGQTRFGVSTGLLASAALIFLIPYLAPAESESLILRLVIGLLFYTGAVALILQGSTGQARATGAVGIAAFIGQTLYIYAETFGGLLDTALFFLLGGLILFGVSYGLLKLRPASDAGHPGDAS